MTDRSDDLFSRFRGADPPPGPARRETARYRSLAETAEIPVGDACRLIKRTLEDHVASPLRVRGEISGLRTPGHWYFNLKDEEGVLSCVAWRSKAEQFEFTPEEGEAVVVTGAVGFYAPQGRTQLYVTGVRRVGEGSLAARFKALCATLRGEGAFEEGHKRPLPALPRRIALLTSATGAAVHDVLDTARRRCPGVGIVLVNVRVQGDGAAEAVVRALRAVDAARARLGVDAILVTRGGGSIEDLWAFNDRSIADALWTRDVGRCLHLPVVAAIGHESDTTVIELVADARAATPTQAAMLLVPDREELGQQVTHAADRLRMNLRRRLERAAERVQSLARHESMRRPELMTERRRALLAGLVRRLHPAARAAMDQRRTMLVRTAARLERGSPATLAATARGRLKTAEARLGRVIGDAIRQQERVDRAAAALRRSSNLRLRGAAQRLVAVERHLGAVDPEQVLARGYSITMRADGTVLRAADEIGTGDAIETRLAAGRVRSTVDAVDDGAPPAPTPAPARDPAAPEMDLFGDVP